MQVNEQLIRLVVSQVLAEVNQNAHVGSASFAGRHGVFDCAQEAVAAAREAYREQAGRLFPTWSEVFDLFCELGYRRDSAA